MSEVDLDRIMAVETRAYPYPWTRKIFTDCIRQPYHCLMYEKAEQIQAYCVLMQALDELHILNLTVNPDFQQRGLGSQLLYTIEEIGQRLQANECFLEVRPSNTAALRLYSQQGFNEIGLRKHYYPSENGREDAVLMGKTLLNRNDDQSGVSD